MSSGLFALLDDIAALAKLAAASLDDAAAQATKAGAKAAGIVIDDTAVTPRYVVGLAASRELPIIWKIALGSLRNKLLILMPAALFLSLVAPWVITPLLMLGGAYLCYEGAEKLLEMIRPHADHADAAALAPDPVQLENAKVAGAIRTDLILSAEIMAITLASVSSSPFWTRAFVLAAVGIAITVLVYGVVALIVKADDAGVALARNRRPLSSLLGGQSETGADRWLRPLTMTTGRGMVQAMPVLLKGLGALGTVAMLWVGGGIVIHGLEELGVAGPAHVLHDVGAAAALALPAAAGAVAWLATAAASAVAGLALGAATVPLVGFVLAPLLRTVRGGGA